MGTTDVQRPVRQCDPLRLLLALYLYSYLNLFGYIGSGTPEDPGTDFGMSVWIEAPDEQAALDWGHVVLADYVRARAKNAGIERRAMPQNR